MIPERHMFSTVPDRPNTVFSAAERLALPVINTTQYVIVCTLVRIFRDLSHLIITIQNSEQRARQIYTV
jgi:hypothetical protein